MTFELYPYGGTCARNRPRRGLGITLDRHRRLLLNEETYAALGLPHYVYLLYDRTARRIGVQAAQGDDTRARRVWSPPSAPHSHRVSAKGFCVHFGLQPYLGRWYGGEMRAGMLQVSLDDQHDVVQVNTVRPADAPPHSQAVHVRLQREEAILRRDCPRPQHRRCGRTRS